MYNNYYIFVSTKKQKHNTMSTLTQKERKLQVASSNRLQIINAIKGVISESKTRMTLKQGMAAFLGVQCKNPENFTMFFATGIQKVRLVNAKNYAQPQTIDIFVDESKLSASDWLAQKNLQNAMSNLPSSMR